MLKFLLAVTLLSVTGSNVFAQAASAPAQGAAASAPAKKHRLHAPKLRPGATPATNPEASPDKKGGN